MEFNKVETYEVGGYIHGEPRRYSEGVRFDVSDNGCSIVAYFNNPTESEIKEFKDGRIKLGYYKYKNVLMMLVKVGQLSWMDAPYSVHLSKYLTKLDDIKEGEGLLTTITLVNAANGEIKTLRVLGANHRFSCSLVKDIEAQKEMSFEEYDTNINYLFNTYSTKEIISRATVLENLVIKK